ncbi:MAG: epimerase, partial [Maritimibacter sp.]
MAQSVLILGSNGKFGSNALEAFRQAGWQVHSFKRGRDDLASAMRGMDVVVAGWNPPGYHLWTEALLDQHRQVAKTAAREGVTVILPGNVYVYGPKASSPWRPDTPHLADNPLGLYRKRLEAIYRDSGAQVIILRMGDFFDGKTKGNWFESYIAAKAAKGVIAYPGDPNAPHAWAYLPDAARAAVALAEKRAQLSRFEDVPFAGYTLTGNELGAAISRALGRKVRVKPFAWWPFYLLKPFMPMLNGVMEMRYLWSLPQRLDGARLQELLPEFEPIPVEKALSETFARMG